MKQKMIQNIDYINKIYALRKNSTVKTFSQIFGQIAYKDTNMNNPIVKKYVTQLNTLLLHSFGHLFVYRCEDDTNRTLNGFKLYY